jgi:hypothetical protein
MIVLLALGGAVLLALLILAVLAYEVRGHVRRFETAVARAGTELRPRLAALQAGAETVRQRTEPAASGRHRAGDNGT